MSLIQRKIYNLSPCPQLLLFSGQKEFLLKIGLQTLAVDIKLAAFLSYNRDFYFMQGRFEQFGGLFFFFFTFFKHSRKLVG